VVASDRKIETAAAAIRDVAELVGDNVVAERAIRWLIALMVLRCDPLAIALTATASARQSTIPRTDSSYRGQGAPTRVLMANKKPSSCSMRFF
jgi:hypothetical protein